MFKLNGTLEYCTEIVKIKEIIPIENSDFLGVTLIDNTPIVIRRDVVKSGDIMFYVSNECQLDSTFLSINNLYEYSIRNLNANFNDIRNLSDEEQHKNCGYFTKNGRVHMKRLRGVQSMGFLFTIDEFNKWLLAKHQSTISLDELSQYIGTNFDTYNDNELCKAYIPNQNNSNYYCNKNTSSKIKKQDIFNRIVNGQFAFHYDTAPLGKCLTQIHPNDNIGISVKLHGTSVVIGKLKTNIPIKLNIFKRVLNKIAKIFNKQLFKTSYVDYGPIYSSRRVIKNQYINSKVNVGFYSDDIWSKYGDIFYPYLTDGMTIYGEIVGYIGTACIQSKYDYGCLPNENKLMIYRITMTNGYGIHTEWNVDDIEQFVKELKTQHPELPLIDFPLLYNGCAKDLYDDIPLDENWHDNFISHLQNDKRFYMEMNEPLCKNKVPREGVVIRIYNDIIPRAFKLKCNKFLKHEADIIDNGVNNDIEMNQ